MKDFEEHLEHPGSWLTIAFAGGDQDQYQFKNVLAKLEVPYILIRDTSQRYHAFGVAGIGNRAEVIQYIRRFKIKYHVRTIGVSSGAYAALLYGQHAYVDQMFVISPLTGREVDDFDPVWHHQIGPSPPGVDDLRQYFKNGPVCPTRAYISDGEACQLDRQMASRIGIKDIVLIPGYAHGKLAQGMRDRGLLADLLKEGSK